MKIEDLKNTKIYLSNEDDRIEFQEKVFKLGVEWNVSGRNIANTAYPYYFVDNNLILSFVSPHKIHFFLECRYKQIFLDDVLAIDEPKEPCKFKPFDKVLVRDEDNDRWRPREFSRYAGKSKYGFVYECTDRYRYKQCVLYDGNEHLVGTCKDINK